MPKYRAAGVAATLQVTDLHQSLPANIHERQLEVQRIERKRIQTLFSTATDLPEKPLLGNGRDRPSFLRFDGQRCMLVPLLICEAGQHIKMRADATSDPKYHDQIPDICISPVGDNQKLDQQKKEQPSQNTLAGATNSSLSLADYSPLVDTATDLFKDGHLCSLPDMGHFADLTLAPRHLDHILSRQGGFPKGSIAVTHKSQRETTSQWASPTVAAQSDVHLLPEVNHQETADTPPQALCVTVDLSDKTTFGGKVGGSLKHDGRDFQVEVFINGELAGSCYVNRRLAGTSAVEMMNGRLVFGGQRVDKQLEAVWIYFSDRASKSENSESGRTSDVDENHRRWMEVNENLIAEADCRGWDTRLGLPPPSADFLRGLAELPVPNDLAHKYGLAIIDVVVTAGDGKKLPQAMGHIQEPTSMRDTRYSVDNKQILPVPKRGPATEIEKTADNDYAHEEGRSAIATPQATPVKHNLAAYIASAVDPVFEQATSACLNPCHQNVASTGDSPEDPAENLFMESSNQQAGFENAAEVHFPSRKRQKLAATPEKSSSSSTQRDYWDIIAEFDFATLDPSKIDLAQNLNVGTTRGGKTSTRPLGKRLKNLKQMRSANRERQVKEMEKALGGSLLDLMYQAVRKDSKVSPEEDGAEQDGFLPDAEDLPHSGNATIFNPTIADTRPTTTCDDLDVLMTDVAPIQTPTSDEAFLPATASIRLQASDGPIPHSLSPGTDTPTSPALADSQQANTTFTADEKVRLVQARAALLSEYGAPADGYLIRKVLMSSTAGVPINEASQAVSGDKHLPATFTPESDIGHARQQPIEMVKNRKRALDHDKSHLAVPVPDHALDNSSNSQTSTRTNQGTERQRDTGFVPTDLPRKMTMEEQFQAISAGIHPPTSSTSIRPFRKVRGDNGNLSSLTPTPPTKANNGGKVLTGTRSHPIMADPPSGSTNVPTHVLAMDDFEPPKLSISSSVGYAEPPMKMFRHTGKARHGEFKEQEVVVGFRFCVF